MGSRGGLRPRILVDQAKVPLVDYACHFAKEAVLYHHNHARCSVFAPAADLSGHSGFKCSPQPLLEY
eukprot:scaffold108145_cov19-Tisochrysis_lutea.AAC.2